MPPTVTQAANDWLQWEIALPEECVILLLHVLLKHLLKDHHLVFLLCPLLAVLKDYNHCGDVVTAVQLQAMLDNLCGNGSEVCSRVLTEWFEHHVGDLHTIHYIPDAIACEHDNGPFRQPPHLVDVRHARNLLRFN